MQAPGNQRHGPALVAAGVAGSVDPLEVGRTAVDLDVREAERLVVDRPVRRRPRDRREERCRAGRSPAACRRFAGACGTDGRRARQRRSNGRRQTTRTSRSPRRCRSRPRPWPEWLRSWRPRSLFGYQELAGGVKAVPGPVVFGMADPDGEVVADPASREQPGRAYSTGGCSSQETRRP